jgi:hypothetical protein
MKKTIRTVGVVFGILVVGGISYCSYHFTSAEQRVTQLCAEIKPPMSISELRAFREKHGLVPDVRDTGTSFLMDRKSFGRHGCKVTMDNGIVKESEYIYAD